MKKGNIVKTLVLIGNVNMKASAEPGDSIGVFVEYKPLAVGVKYAKIELYEQYGLTLYIDSRQIDVAN